MINGRLLNCLTLCVVVLALTIVPGQSLGQAEDGQIDQEYFIQQGADEALLIRINGFEAEFESKLSGQAGNLLLRSGISGSRIAPVFQYVNAASTSRQLNIDVSSNLYTDRSEFDLGLTRLKIWDERSSSLARAYQGLSFGMESGGPDTSANWTVKIEALINASRVFHRFGMQELRLWSHYLAAHLIYLHLHDHSIVITMMQEILSELKSARFRKIELAALQLQSAAVIALKESGTLPMASPDQDPVQLALSRVAGLAESMGFGFELAMALNASAADYAGRSMYDEALEQYQRAVAISDSVGDAGLIKSIRESIVQIHAIQGDAPASNEVLQEIETRLVEEGAGDELALNLLAQGRLSINSYDYPRAIDVLKQGLIYENNSAIRRQLNFELAKASYGRGHPDDAIRYLQAANIRPGSRQKRSPNSMLDIGEGLRMMAAIHRGRGEFSKMHKARSAQGQYKPEQAAYLYQQALDELVSRAGKHGSAQSLFRQSYRVAAATGNRDLKNLSRLQICTLGGSGDDLCTHTANKNAFDSLQAAAVPRRSAKAMYLWAQILEKSGQHDQAVDMMGQLADEILFLRDTLPGVLGGWYREWHEDLFEYYLELSTASPGGRGQGKADGMESLLALSKIRFIERQSDIGASESMLDTTTDLLRVQLAQRENSKPNDIFPDLDKRINRELASLRNSFAGKYGFLSSNGLQRHLRSLSSQEAMLTYHLSPTKARVWVGHNGQVRQLNISNPGALYNALRQARPGLASIGVDAFDKQMDTLGKHLIAPVADFLPETVYWIPAGPLLGFPLDATRINGRYLLERHSLVSLVSFPSNPDPGASLQIGAGQTAERRMFLAGHPQDYSERYASSLDTSEEIRVVADIFVGPGLRIVQGTALLPDEFLDERFALADLVHLTSPGIIDLDYPEQSRLELSGDEFSQGRTYFRPQDLGDGELNADLVFMSATRTMGEPHTGFNKQTGLVSGFIHKGATVVIASLWDNHGKATEAFVTDFYRRLVRSGDIADSLTQAKRQYLSDQRANGLYDWAAFQIFMN